MNPRDQDVRLPDVLVIVASAEDAAALAPLAVLDPEIHPVLVATGPDPMLVDEALDDLGALAGRILLTGGPCDSPVAETAELLPRLDALVADDRPAAVLVRGGSATAMAAAQVAVWRGVPVVAAEVSGESGSVMTSANRAAIAEYVAWQGRPAGTEPDDAGGTTSRPRPRRPDRRPPDRRSPDGTCPFGPVRLTPRSPYAARTRYSIACL